MNSNKTNSNKTNLESDDAFQSLVEELSTDLLQQELDDSTTPDLGALEARILKAASDTPQVFERTSNGARKEGWWTSVKTAVFTKPSMSIYPFVATSVLVAIVMIVGSPMPTDNSVPKEVITYSSVKAVEFEQDPESTFQELWLAEDEILFAVDI